MENKISLCPSCNCMTHTVDGRCGKCGYKEEQDFRDRFDYKFGYDLYQKDGPTKEYDSEIREKIKTFISREIAAAEKRVHEKYAPAMALADKVRRIACCLGCKDYHHDSHQCDAREDGRECPILKLESVLNEYERGHKEALTEQAKPPIVQALP